jgi:hypothetical protein
VEEILALNPDLRPQALQVGQAIVLPAPAAAQPGAQSATAIPLTVEIAGVGLYQTPTGGLWVVGEVWNRGSLPAENLQVAITFNTAAQENPIMTNAWVEPAVLLPGEAGPFATLLAQAPPADAAPTFAVVGGATLPEAGSRTRNLAVGESVVTITAGQVRMTGVLTNTGAAPAEQIAIIATFLDASGQVTGYYRHSLQIPLGTGESTPFAFDVTPPGGLTVAWRLVAEGRQVDGN